MTQCIRLFYVSVWTYYLKLGRNMNNRIKSLDNTKWILTLLICLYHIQFMGDEKYSTLFYWEKDLGNCVVQVFSLISGFLFF